MLGLYRFVAKGGPKAIAVIAILLLPLGIVPKMELKGSEWYWVVVSWIQSNFNGLLFTLIIILIVVHLLTWFARWIIRRRSPRNPALKGVLNALQKILSEGELSHTYRATLFKNHKNKWLKRYARSGELTLNSRRKFRIDANDESKNEGIAGRCWYWGDVAFRYDLPDVSQPDANDDDVIAYSKATFYNVSKIRKRVQWLEKRPAKWFKWCLPRPELPRSRCLAGFPILVSGKKWGVLVFDSEDPKAITDGIARKHATKYFLAAISEALQESANAMDSH